MNSILMAFIMDLLIGDPYGFPHPVRFMGKFIRLFEKGIRKRVHTSKELKYGGFFLVLSTIILTYLTSFTMLYVAKKIHPMLNVLVNILLLWTCFAAKCLKEEAVKVYHALKKGDIEKGRQLIAYLVGRDTADLDVTAITKATVETVAENTSDGIIAPLFYMIIGGAPLALVYKAINTMDSMVGYKNDQYIDLGFAAAKADDIANFIPARITGFFIGLVSILYSFNWKHSFRILKRDCKNHASPNSGYPEAAVAGALEIQLGGTSKYFGKEVIKPTIGDKIRSIHVDDIVKTTKLMYGSTILLLAIYCIIIILIEYFTA